MKNKELRDLFKAAGALKHVNRTGWRKKVGITHYQESVADHSFRMAIMAMVLGEELGLDSSKLVRMCLIHDIAESVLGDKMPEEKKSQSAHREYETKVIDSLARKQSRKIESILLSDWNELVQSKTKEAKLAWQIDKLEMALQAKDYIRMGYNKKELNQFMKIKIDKNLRQLLRLY